MLDLIPLVPFLGQAQEIEDIKFQRGVLAELLGTLRRASFDYNLGDLRVVPNSDINADEPAEDTVIAPSDFSSMKLLVWPAAPWGRWLFAWNYIVDVVGRFGPGTKFPLGEDGETAYQTRNGDAIKGFATIDQAIPEVVSLLVELQKMLGNALPPLPELQTKKKMSMTLKNAAITGTVVALAAGAVILYLTRGDH